MVFAVSAASEVLLVAEDGGRIAEVVLADGEDGVAGILAVVALRTIIDVDRGSIDVSNGREDVEVSLGVGWYWGRSYKEAKRGRGDQYEIGHLHLGVLSPVVLCMIRFETSSGNKSKADAFFNC